MGKKWKKVQKRCVRVVAVAQSSPQRLKYIYFFLVFCKKWLTLAFWCKKVHRFSKFHFFSDFSSLWFGSNGMGGHEKFLKVRYLQKNLSNQGFTFFGKLFLNFGDFWLVDYSDKCQSETSDIQKSFSQNPQNMIWRVFWKYFTFSSICEWR